ncbi:deoxyribodipyrimidine photo-lyase [Haematospirillum sp. H1815]|nr:deoxyribodipyrimidine photo-lyase [Haematospirillum sp. H1815]
MDLSMNTHSPALVWFRYDLRLDDHPALVAAIESGSPVAGVFVLDPDSDGRPLGAASRWWLHHSLKSLTDQLARHGVTLILRQGRSATEILSVAKALNAGAVFWNEGHTPWMTAQDNAVQDALKSRSIQGVMTRSGLIADPGAVRNKAGGRFRVFTPFWKTLSTLHPPHKPLDVPSQIRPAHVSRTSGSNLQDFGLLPTSGPDWTQGLRDTWEPGEDGAFQRLGHFLDGVIDDYATGRDFPDRAATSRLSAHLRFGEISVRRIWDATLGAVGEKGLKFLSEVGWREFNHHILFQHPSLHTEPLRPEFCRFPWQDDPKAFRLWCRGQTGYPIVDAGMRELWHTGWMHNRVRMVVGSFLVKDLLVPWQKGEDWFWDTLVDACPANNPGNWQWVAGCGADAAPFFRIFNPVLQGEKFDPAGTYVRRWIPELRTRNARSVQHPVDPDDLFARSAYPPPIVNHGHARDRALAALKALDTAT